NPETLSTDFDVSDRLYFEPLTSEDVTNVMEQEEPLGFLSQFGGQTAINLSKNLVKRGFYLLGTSQESIDLAEDREKFDKVLHRLKIPRPKGFYIRSFQEAKNVIKEIGFPVLLRPSYVLGGRAMHIIDNLEELENYFKRRDLILPLWMDQFVLGKEAEVDLLCDGEEVFIPGIMEHIERAGIHSGDSIAVYPPYSLSFKAQEKIIEYSKKIALALRVRGLLNIQFVIDKNDNVFVLEANPRASRTVPFLSKALKLPLVKWATKISLGYKLRDFGIESEVYPHPKHFSVKAPVFSFTKIKSAEIELGPEMRSTGEVMGIDYTWEKALYKALLASGIKIPLYNGKILITTYFEAPWDYLLERNFELYSIEESENNLLIPISIEKDEIFTLTKKRFDLVVSVGRKDKGWRRACYDLGISCVVSEDTVNAILKMLKSLDKDIDYRAIQDYFEEKEDVLVGKSMETVLGQNL
ncbi:MAG: ATP-grasp domain-containing protein, partial [Dictyoglomaceae bacterium]|nr:ATP-grasp domain-containing protein [Dictyoglomaceae bacterium]